MKIHTCPEEAVLFVGSLFSKKQIFDTVLPEMKKEFGPVLFESPVFPWNYTSYYEKEIGVPIFRNFIFFDPLIDPCDLVDIKHATRRIEALFSVSGKRNINLDPGYLTLAKVVLASTKNYSHRIYLGKGIFGEMALSFKQGRFVPHPYTYYDYRDDLYLKVFIKARSLLKEKKNVYVAAQSNNH
jgi:hypothetical protein